MLKKGKSMRLFALPLTRSRPNQPSLVYYLAHLPPKPKSKPETRTSALVKKAVNKAVETWNGWGKTSESSWKYRIHALGMKAQARLEFEELALKSLDPALGPRIASMGEGAKQLEAIEKGRSVKLRLIHPETFSSVVKESPLRHLEVHAAHRAPKHKRLFYLYTFISPFTAPFMLIPVIPNLPFFFCVWRAWSNYRAYKAASYLQSLISARAVEPSPNSKLDSIYSQSRSRLSALSTSGPRSRPSGKHIASSQDRRIDEDVILDEKAVHHIVDEFDLPKDSALEVIRALNQAGTRMAAARARIAEEPHKEKRKD